MFKTQPCGKILLAGNPNVGKSTLFNQLTGKRVHTGNWSGKTVSVSEGYGVHNDKTYLIRDLPGISSLSNPVGEELAAFREIIAGDFTTLILVADVTNFHKSLSLLLRISELTDKCILCLNFWDECKKEGIKVDLPALEFILGIPVVPMSAKKNEGISRLFDAIENLSHQPLRTVFTPLYSEFCELELASFSYDRRDTIRKIYSSSDYSPLKAEMSIQTSIIADKIKNLTITQSPPKESYADRILCSPLWGPPVMLIFTAAILFITIVLSNYPSMLLSAIFGKGALLLSSLLNYFSIPPMISSLITDGIYSTTSTVIAVMLPPMIIFFPLFAILENSGYLPRIAFNLDNTFSKCGSCGKCALTMCMGLGCNCVGIANSAIIPSKRERLISILTNSFIPCNGRFGALISIIAIFLAKKSSILAAFITALVIGAAIAFSLLASLLLSKTILKGKGEPYILELPKYRRVNIIKTVTSSITEHTPKILLRTSLTSAAAGGIIYFLNYNSILHPLATFLDPFAAILGLDGIILLSFFLSFTANEITLPIILMLYTASTAMPEASSREALSLILRNNGWNTVTAVSFIIFTLMHFPCISAIFSIKRETKSIKYTVLAIFLPLIFGIIVCAVSNLLFSV